jgi:hypothetical protein
MNTNELQSEVEANEEICELTVEELDAVGGGSGGVIHTDGIVQPDSGGGVRPFPILTA